MSVGVEFPFAFWACVEKYKPSQGVVFLVNAQNATFSKGSFTELTFIVS